MRNQTTAFSLVLKNFILHYCLDWRVLFIYRCFIVLFIALFRSALFHLFPSTTHLIGCLSTFLGFVALPHRIFILFFCIGQDLDCERKGNGEALSRVYL